MKTGSKQNQKCAGCAAAAVSTQSSVGKAVKDEFILCGIATIYVFVGLHIQRYYYYYYYYYYN